MPQQSWASAASYVAGFVVSDDESSWWMSICDSRLHGLQLASVGTRLLASGEAQTAQSGQCMEVNRSNHLERSEPRSLVPVQVTNSSPWLLDMTTRSNGSSEHQPCLQPMHLQLLPCTTTALGTVLRSVAPLLCPRDHDPRTMYASKGRVFRVIVVCFVCISYFGFLSLLEMWGQCFHAMVDYMVCQQPHKYFYDLILCSSINVYCTLISHARSRHSCDLTWDAFPTYCGFPRVSLVTIAWLHSTCLSL